MPAEFIINKNAQHADTRFATLEGREHIVVPMVMIVEGVHPGSQGPMFYGVTEMKESVPVWNHKPVSVYHPKDAGSNYVSACSPESIDASKVGIILNTRVDQPKRKGVYRMPAEAWLEPARLDAIDERIMAALESRTPMEVSTGLFANATPEVGEYGGTAYNYRATGYQPDHLALLPDKEGACSMAKGAGLLVNEKAMDTVARHGLASIMRHALQSVYDQYELGRKNLTANAMSYGDIQEALYKLMRPANTNEISEYGGCWIAAVYPEFFIYEQDGKTYSLGYKVTNDVVGLIDGDTPTEVRRVVEYRTLEGKFVSNVNQNQEPKMKTRAERVAAIIANAGSPWKADDAAMLQGLPEEQFVAIEGAPAKVDTPPVVNTAPPATPPAPAAAPAPAPVVNAAAPMTPEQWMAAAPTGMRDMITNGLALAHQQRTDMTAAIVANSGGAYTADDVASLPLPQVQKLHKAITANMAKAPVVADVNDFSALFGGGNYTGGGGVFVGNAVGDTTGGAPPVLDLPTLG